MNAEHLHTVKCVLFFTELFVAIAASLNYYKYKHTFLKHFLFIIWYAVINEVIGYYFTQYINRNNTVLYNIYRLIEFSFYLLLYYNIVSNLTNKKLIKLMLYLYLVSVLINCFYESFVTEYFIKNYILGASFIVISIIMYFSEILHSDKIIYIDKYLYFWISFAALIYFLPNIPFKVVTKYYVNSPTIPYVYWVTYLLSFINFIILIIGFTWSNKIQRQ